MGYMTTEIDLITKILAEIVLKSHHKRDQIQQKRHRFKLAQKSDIKFFFISDGTPDGRH
jgi:hypothetical protein